MSDPGETVKKRFNRDKKVWDECAKQYEASIVAGHPDVVAYTEFEEDFLDRILLHLMRDKNEDIYLYDVGCGSARLHLHYGLKTIRAGAIPVADAEVVKELRSTANRHHFDHHFAEHLKHIGGLDFSPAMIELAKEKIIDSGLETQLDKRLVLEVGSAYDMKPIETASVPVVVNVCNSIGVMQGIEGAELLFQAMRRSVEEAKGIAIVSCYRKKSIPDFALGNYESTMNVSGQPRWLSPETYADESYLKIPKYYKQAYDKSEIIIADVYDDDGNCIETDFEFKRIPDKVKNTIKTGKIEMHSDYSSNWYSFEQVDEWIDKFWQGGITYHLAGNAVDCVRAQPVQLAIFDPADRLKSLFNTWWN